MDFKYKHNPEHLFLILDQVWEAKEEHGGDLTVYDRLAPYEVSQIKEFLPEDPKVIWEMGAGLGRGSIYLNHYYGNKKSRRWYLFDRDGFSEENMGAFKPKKDEYYNDFKLGESFCKLNGLDTFLYLDTEIEGDWAQAYPPDLVFSFCSFGMHVELERYMDKMISKSKDSTVFIFGTRHAGYNDKSFSDRFKEVIFIPSKGQAPFPIENWLILRGMK